MCNVRISYRYHYNIIIIVYNIYQFLFWDASFQNFWFFHFFTISIIICYYFYYSRMVFCGVVGVAELHDWSGRRIADRRCGGEGAKDGGGSTRWTTRVYYHCSPIGTVRAVHGTAAAASPDAHRPASVVRSAPHPSRRWSRSTAFGR